MKISEYKKKIQKANTREELQAISYKAMFDGDKTWNKVIDLCLKREVDLGLL